jgi:hypothetical protein
MGAEQDRVRRGGAAHQTGRTALIADIIRRRHGAVPAEPDIAEE